MTSSIETVIVGGGQGGLALSYHLKARGREHVVLEKAAQVGNAWRNDRWDSFTLVTPNWAFMLPGASYAGDQPEAYMGRDEVVRRFETWMEANRLPVEFGVQANSVVHDEAGFTVQTTHGALRAKNVVIATGMFQNARIPAFASQLPAEILQITCTQYRHPGLLPPGAVLVVGSAQTGAQIAEELYQSGRTVYLCTGKSGRVPRRYRGKDIFEWMRLTGFFNRTPAQLPSPQARFGGNPHVTGKNGGHNLNLHQFARDGVRLLGHLQGVRDGTLMLAPDMHDNLRVGDAFEQDLTHKVDMYIAANGLQAPAEALPALADGYALPLETELNLKAAGISAVIWTLGFQFDFSLVKLPVFDDAGFPLTHNGVTEVKGLYFAGLPWLPDQKTGLLLGVGDHAQLLAEHIAGR